jgi:phosphoglycerate kinase
MFRSIKDRKVKGRVIFLRADLNVPTSGTEILDDTRIRAVLPTIEYLVSHGAKIILASHFGKASGSGFDENFSIRIILNRLQSYLPKTRIYYSRECIGSDAKKIVNSAKFGEIVLLENLRFYKGEEDNDEKFAKELASLADTYVNDAFSTCHREHASMERIPDFLDSYAGINLKTELDTLTKLVFRPKKPLMVIVGGSKVSTKLELLKAIVSMANYLVVGGGMANTFLLASGFTVGKSMKEENLAGEALEILKKADESGCKVILPVDVVVTREIKDNQVVRAKNLKNIAVDDIIVDLGPETIELIKNSLGLCKTVVWNGPIGIYEISPFDRGTNTIAKTISEMTLNDKIKSIAGGGDILAALNKIGVYDDLTYLTTAGGAFLKWLEKGSLPAIEKLKSGDY